MTSPLSPLQIRRNYVYNPSNDWYSCTVSSGDQVMGIEVIPPRSSRTFPSSYQTPIISIAKTLRTDQIRSYDVNSIETGPIVLEPIDVKFDAVWKGTIEISTTVKEISASVIVDSSNISGFFYLDSSLYILKGTIQTKTHLVVISLFEIEKRKRTKLNGRIDYEEKLFNIDVKCQTHHITLTVPDTEKTTFQVDPLLTGKYLAFYTKGEAQNEMNLKLTLLKNGILSGAGTENRTTFTVHGHVGDSKIILMKWGTDITYYNGTIESGTEVFISGDWFYKTDTGKFTFIKEM